MKITRTKLIIAGVVVIILIIVAVLFFGARKTAQTGTDQTATTSPSASASPDQDLHTPQPTVPASAQPPAGAQDAIAKYLQAREDGVGADMSSPSAWLALIKPITTTAFYTESQPAPGAPAGAEYRTAHNNNYVVRAAVTSVAWNTKQGGSKYGQVFVQFTDATVNRGTGATISSGNLPFGWTHSGPQHPVNLKIVEQNGVWLVDDDTTGTDPD